MKIIGIILLVISVISAIGIFYLHSKDENDMALVCIWITGITAVVGILLLFLPEILHPSAIQFVFKI